MEIKVWKESHGWVYQVGNVYQEYHPDLSGFVPMTELEAHQLSVIIYERLNEN